MSAPAPAVAPPAEKLDTETTFTDGDHDRIPLTGKRGAGLVALIDPDDFDRVTAVGPWHLQSGGYVVHFVHLSGSGSNRVRREILLHRFVSDVKHGDPTKVDHINRDKLDNRKGNLRRATTSQNSQNILRDYGTSSHRGVSFNRRRGKWRAYATLQGVQHHLGYFTDEAAAARAASAFRSARMPFAVEPA